MEGVKVEDIGEEDYEEDYEEEEEEEEEYPDNYPTQEEIDAFYGQEEQYEDEDDELYKIVSYFRQCELTPCELPDFESENENEKEYDYEDQDVPYASEYPTPYELARCPRDLCDALDPKYAERLADFRDWAREEM
jgi:hypothetical protein